MIWLIAPGPDHRVLEADANGHGPFRIKSNIARARSRGEHSGLAALSRRRLPLGVGERRQGVAGDHRRDGGQAHRPHEHEGWQCAQYATSTRRGPSGRPLSERTRDPARERSCRANRREHGPRVPGAGKTHMMLRVTAGADGYHFATVFASSISANAEFAVRPMGSSRGAMNSGSPRHRLDGRAAAVQQRDRGRWSGYHARKEMP